MHELSIAIGIINIAENEIKKANKKKVELIELEIGSLSGVELNSLDYIWESAVKNTVLENAKKLVDYKQAKAKCSECNSVFKMNNIYDSCPECKSHLKNILQGKELRVKSLEVI